MPYLTVAEEDELEKYVVDACELGYGKTRHQVKGIVEKVAVEKGTLRSTHVTDGWWTRFFQRHTKLSLRSGDATAHVRMNAVSNEKLKHYFSLLKKCLDENDLCSHPERIYNMDETGVPLDPKPPKVLCRKGQKKIHYRSTGNKSQITVLGCANATGQAQPPFVIFDAKQLNILWSRGEVPGTRYSLSKNGWTDQELFNGWLQNHFLKHAVQGRPLMLLIDGHSSHYDPESIRFAKENSVIIFCLPPHTTHEAQPLNVSLFGPLKQHWQEVCHQFLQSSQGKVVSKLNFSQLFSQAWMKTITAENICSGFRRAGIVPFNPGALNLPEESCPANPAVSDSSDHDDQENNPNVANAPGPGPFFTDEEDWLSVNHPQSVSVDLAPAEQCGSPSNSGRSFTAEEEDRFARRFTEGYDLHDPKYEEWLSINHPCSVSVAGEFDVFPLTPDPAEQSRSQQTPAMSTRQCPHLTTPVMHPPSMVHSPSVSPIAHPPSASPVVRTPSVSPIARPPSASPVVRTPSVSPIAHPPSASPVVRTPSVSPISLPPSASPIARPPSASRVMCTPTHRRSMCSVINPTSTSPSLSPLTPSTSKSCPPGTTSTSLLGKHLKPLNRNTTQKTGQARVLTSDDCLRNLEEKKRKKETEAAEKEQRKLERERKKKEREEEIKRKKEEVKRRKEERERKRMHSQA